MKVQKVQKVQRVQRVQRVADCPSGVKVLKMDGPSAQGFLSLTALRAEGCGIALRAMSIKSALRDLLLVSYDIVSTTVISHLRWLFPPLVPYGTTFPPLSGGTIKHREAISPYATLS